MPPTGNPPPGAAAAAAESSAAPPAAEGETAAPAGVRAREEGDAVKEIGVEDRDEVAPEGATGVEPVEKDPDEEPAEVEDPNVEEAEEEEDPEEDRGEGDKEEAAVAAAKECGDEEESAMAVVSEEGSGEDAGMEHAAVEEHDETEDEEPEEADEEDVMEEDATKVSGAGGTSDDMNELPEEHEESGDGGTHGVNDKDSIAGQLSADDDAQNDELDPSLLVLGPVSVENAKDLEIFVGGLPKDCAEEDITMVFSQFGEIGSIKIVKHSARKKSNCIAFVRYTNTEAAKGALAEFKEGVEVKGKRVRVSASQGNNTLYLGNICKSWTKDQVLNNLKGVGIKEFEMSLPDDPNTGGRNRGFAFLKFATHGNAEAAFLQLQQPDARFGIDRGAEESARTPTESNEELTMKVKTVYLEHVPLSWDERKIEECCEGYGKIQDVRLLKKSKKKIISFVEFSSRKSALACVEGLNNAKIGGEVKLIASLARPRRKIQLDKKSAAGGFKVDIGATCEDADNSMNKKDQKKEVVVKKNSPEKLPKGDVSKVTSQVDAEVPQTSNCYKGKRKAGKSKNTSVNENERPSKKARKSRDVLTRPSDRTRHGGYARAAYAGESAGRMKRSAGPRYATSKQSYPSVGASSRSKPNARDLEPHAGYIPPANRIPANRVPANRAPANHVQITYVYDQPRTASSTIHHIDGLPYAREIAAPHPAYSGYTSNPQYQGGYTYTYLPPPPPSRSYHPETGAYSPQRRYY